MAKRKSSDGNGGSNPILGAGAKKKESLTNRATANHRSATRKSFSTIAARDEGSKTRTTASRRRKSAANNNNHNAMIDFQEEGGWKLGDSIRNTSNMGGGRSGGKRTTSARTVDGFPLEIIVTKSEDMNEDDTKLDYQVKGKKRGLDTTKKTGELPSFRQQKKSAHQLNFSDNEEDEGGCDTTAELKNEKESSQDNLPLMEIYRKKQRRAPKDNITRRKDSSDNDSKAGIMGDHDAKNRGRNALYGASMNNNNAKPTTNAAMKNDDEDDSRFSNLSNDLLNDGDDGGVAVKMANGALGGKDDVGKADTKADEVAEVDKSTISKKNISPKVKVDMSVTNTNTCTKEKVADQFHENELEKKTAAPINHPQSKEEEGESLSFTKPSTTIVNDISSSNSSQLLPPTNNWIDQLTSQITATATTQFNAQRQYYEIKLRETKREKSIDELQHKYEEQCEENERLQKELHDERELNLENEIKISNLMQEVDMLRAGS